MKRRDIFKLCGVSVLGKFLPNITSDKIQTLSKEPRFEISYDAEDIRRQIIDNLEDIYKKEIFSCEYNDTLNCDNLLFYNDNDIYKGKI